MLFSFLVLTAFCINAQPPAPSYIYGINDNNEIVEVDLVTKANKVVYNTGLTGNSNAFAFDNNRNHFFFLDAAGRNLQFWDRGSKFVQIATAAQMGIAAAPSPIPANAAYYDNAYWFFTERTHTLNKVTLNYTGSTPGFVSLKQYGITNTSIPTATNNAFGDIAINSSGLMYAVTAQGPGGNFYKVDLKTLVETTAPSAAQNVATLIKSGLTDPETTTVIGLQIGFSSDQSKLFGHNYNNGKWYEINTSNGDLTLVTSGATPFTSVFPTNGLRDISDLAANTKVETVDLSATVTDNRIDYMPGGTLTYVVVITNNNISGSVPVPGATVTVGPASGITFGSWTLTYSGGSTVSGSGNITDYVLSSLPVGGTATFTITATVSGTASGNLTTSASVTSPPGYSDIDATNNSATDTDALPLTWGGFSAKADGSDVKLAWSTLMEENTLDFLVQRSQSGQPWSEVGQVQAAGFSQNTRHYNFTDRNVPLGLWQYRLLQRDKGGLSSHSETRSVNVKGVAELLTVYGNPVTNGQFKVSVRENGNMTVVDNMGRTVYRADLTPGVHTIQTSQWMKGSYNYRFTGTETATGRLVIQ